MSTKIVPIITERTTREDLECLILARLGFTWGTIAERTGLSTGQIYRRLKIAGISTRDYRTGQSDLAKKVMELAHQDSRQYFDTMVSKVRRYLIEERAA